MRKKLSKIVIILLTILALTACSGEKTKTTVQKLSEKKVESSIKKVAKDEVEKYLHVPSPDWRDQIFYFILTDRFNDGDKTNNDFGYGEYEPSKKTHYNGGDLKGITEKLDYIKDLGATAVWITPPVANQWYDPWIGNYGYHGYYAENFKEVDKHMGTLDDYKELSATLHKNGMYLIQDIVTNHTGNFMQYKGGEFNKENLGENFEINEKSIPVSKPSQYPFNLNDVRVKKDKDENIYNYRPYIKDFKNMEQVLTYQMSSLDDINTSNPKVRTALKDSYNYWIKEVGVDAFRIDTIVYVEHDFWNDFIHSEDKDSLGLKNFAKSIGKDDFFTFGEPWVNAIPYDESGDIRTAAFTGTKKKAEMEAVLNFPMHITMKRVFGEGKPTSYLSYRLENLKKYYNDPYKQVNFIDNHDIGRFLASAPYIAFKQNLLFMLTSPGIPVIYMGTGQQLIETRGAMFAGGFDSKGEDHFDKENDAYKFLQKAISLRKEYEVLRKGEIEILKDSKSGAGVFVYKMTYNGETALGIFNTSDEPVILNNIKTGLEEGTKLKLLMGLLKIDKDAVLGENGNFSSILQPRAGLIYLAEKEKVAIIKNKSKISIEEKKENLKTAENFIIRGKAIGEGKISIIIDTYLKKAIKVKTFENGEWEAEIPVSELDNGEHILTAYLKTANKNEFVYSEDYKFEVNIEEVKIIEIDDEIGDDCGPKGTYTYPAHDTFSRDQDIKKLIVYKQGMNLKLGIEMANPISTIWNPKYGFDHVSYSIYIDLPEKDGIEELPYQYGKLKDGMKWDYMCLIGGWTNLMYDSRGAGELSFGGTVNPLPKVYTKEDENTVYISLNGKSMGIKDFTGAKIYISTWDYDDLENSYRRLKPESSAFIFGGGELNDPRIMDELDIIEIK